MKLREFAVILAAMVVVAAMALSIGSILFGARSVERLTDDLLEPSIQYVLPEGFPKEFEGCPGSALPPFAYSVRVSRPVMAEVITTWVPIDPRSGEVLYGRQTGDDTVRHFSYAEPGRYVVRIDATVIPSGLRPGVWRREVAASGHGAHPDVYQQTVEVLDCDANRKTGGSP